MANNNNTYITHTIKKGETLSDIAQDSIGTSGMYDIARYNNIKDINNIKEGDVIKIPKNVIVDINKNPYKQPIDNNKYYTVKSGDNVSLIAKENGISINDIYRYNNGLKYNPNIIKIGERIRIPDKQYSGVSKYESNKHLSLGIIPRWYKSIGDYDDTKNNNKLVDITRLTKNDVNNAINITSKVKQQLYNNYTLNSLYNNSVSAESLMHNKNTTKIIEDTVLKNNKEDSTKKNASLSFAMISAFYGTNTTNQYYIVDDKAHSKVYLCLNGDIVFAADAAHGAAENPSSKYYRSEKDIEESKQFENDLKRKHSLIYRNGYAPDDYDDITRTYAKKNGSIEEGLGNMTTPAGVVYSSAVNDPHYGGAFVRRTQDMVKNNSPYGMPSSMHRGNVYNPNASNKLFGSNGCSRLEEPAMRRLYSYLKGRKDVPTFILPNSTKDKFTIDDSGELVYKANGANKIRFSPNDNSQSILFTVSSDSMKNQAKLDDHQMDVVRKFSGGLCRYRNIIKSKYNLSNSDYAKLSVYAVGILGTESSFGRKGMWLGNFTGAMSRYVGAEAAPDIYYKDKIAREGATIFGVGKADNNKEMQHKSLGLTQIRYYNLSDDTKAFLHKQLGSDMYNLEDPENAALVTISKLADSFVHNGKNINKTIGDYNKKQSYMSSCLRKAQQVGFKVQVVGDKNISKKYQIPLNHGSGYYRSLLGMDNKYDAILSHIKSKNK